MKTSNLAQQQVLDADLKEAMGKLLGDPDNLDNTLGRCAPNVACACWRAPRTR